MMVTPYDVHLETCCMLLTSLTAPSRRDSVTARANSSPHEEQKKPPSLWLGPPIAVSCCTAGFPHHSQRLPCGAKSVTMELSKFVYNMAILRIPSTPQQQVSFLSDMKSIARSRHILITANAIVITKTSQEVDENQDTAYGTLVLWHACALDYRLGFFGRRRLLGLHATRHRAVGSHPRPYKQPDSYSYHTRH